MDLQTGGFRPALLFSSHVILVIGVFKKITPLAIRASHSGAKPWEDSSGNLYAPCPNSFDQTVLFDVVLEASALLSTSCDLVVIIRQNPVFPVDGGTTKGLPLAR